MLLKMRSKDNQSQEVIVKVSDIHTLFDPYAHQVIGRLQWGEEEQDPEPLAKENLYFLSGEALPQCRVNFHYRDEEVDQHRCGTQASGSGLEETPFSYFGA